MKHLRFRVAIRGSAVAFAGMLAYALVASSQTPPTLKIEPTSVTFSPVLTLPPLGLTRTKSVTLSLSKKASGPVTITGLTSSDSEFSATTAASPCPTASPGQYLISPGQKCVFPIVFQPNTAGTRKATLTINNNGANPQPVVHLLGVGVLGKLTFSPSVLNFPKVASGTVSSPKPVTLVNKNPLPISFATPSITGPFLLDNADTTCGSTLAASGGNCKAMVEFAPVALGSKKGTLSISGNFAGPQKVQLTGIGKPGPTITPTPTVTLTITPTPTATSTSSGATPTATASATPGPSGSPTATPGGGTTQYLPLLQ